MESKLPDWNLKLRAWIEKDDRKVLGPGRFELLGHIAVHRSISAAAKQMGMSYRRAWELVKDMNDAAGTALVEVSTGGTGGGGAVLTSEGLKAMRVYRRILEAMDRFGEEIERQLSGDD